MSVTRFKIAIAALAAVLVAAVALGPGVTHAMLQQFGGRAARQEARQQRQAARAARQAAGPAAARRDENVIDSLTVPGDGPPVITRVDVQTGGAGGEFTVRLNNKFNPALQRTVAAGGRTELGAVLLSGGDRLDLSSPDGAPGSAKLSITPLRGEAQKDHTAELRAAHVLVFQDDFNSLQSTPGSAGALWSTTIKRDHRIHNSSPDSFYSDADFSHSVGAGDTLNPYSVRGGILTIKAGEIPPALIGRVRQALGSDAPPDLTGPNSLRFFSGSLSTHPSWSQTYGYFEMRAKLPRGEGFWPAFWLTASVGWPPEIDMLEAIYHAQSNFGVNHLHTSLHYKRVNPAGQPVGPNLDLTTDNPNPSPASLYDAFHLYAADWDPDWINFYLDGRLIYRVATPPQMHSPMELLANLQIGTRNPQPKWGADLADPRDLAHTMDIDFIADYRLASAYPEIHPDASGAIVAPPPRSPAAGWTLVGDNRPNRIETSSGTDIVRGGGGADTIVVHGALDAHKIIEDFNPAGGDRLVITGFPFGTAQEALAAARQVGPDIWIMAGARPIAPQTIILRNLKLSQLPASALQVSDPQRTPPAQNQAGPRPGRGGRRRGGGQF